jgi:hypothetical protein
MTMSTESLKDLLVVDDGRVWMVRANRTARGQGAIVCSNEGRHEYMGSDGWRDDPYYYPSVEEAERALAESELAAVGCDLIRWRQIRVAGWAGFMLDYDRHLVEMVSISWSALCLRHPVLSGQDNGCIACPLGGPAGTLKLCIPEWQAVIGVLRSADGSGHFDREVATMVDCLYRARAKVDRV